MAIVLKRQTARSPRGLWAGAQALGLPALGLLLAIAAAAAGPRAHFDARPLTRHAVLALVTAELVADAQAAFAERDADRNGVITPGEVPYLHADTFGRLDANGDGHVTLTEGAPTTAQVAVAAKEAEAALREAFGLLDTNHDSLLQPAEARAFAGDEATPIDFEGLMRGLQAMYEAPVPAAAAGPHDRLPVLMLPGFLMPASSFGLMRRTLVEAGYRDFKVLNRWPWFTGIDEYAAEGKWLGDRLRRRAGTERLVLLGHSLGGLVGRAMIQQQGYEAHVSHYVSFGTPHHGTLLGPFAQWYAKSAEQMTPGSRFLTALNASEGRPSAIRYTSVHAEFEEIVYPRSSVHLAGADNPQVKSVYHISMVLMPAVCATTLASLRR